jgi:hypothetical protein
MSSVALAVCTARDLTSDATTAKPFPASPARAASIVALSVTDLLRAIGQSANLAISVTRLARGKSDNVRRVGELTADLGGGARQLICDDSRGFYVRRCFVECLHSAFGTLGSLFGGAK